MEKVPHKYNIKDSLYHNTLQQIVEVHHRYYPETSGKRHYDKPLYYVCFVDKDTGEEVNYFVSAEEELYKTQKHIEG